MIMIMIINIMVMIKIIMLIINILQRVVNINILQKVVIINILLRVVIIECWGLGERRDEGTPRPRQPTLSDSLLNIIIIIIIIIIVTISIIIIVNTIVSTEALSDSLLQYPFDKKCILHQHKILRKEFEIFLDECISLLTIVTVNLCFVINSKDLVVFQLFCFDCLLSLALRRD